MTAIKNVFNSLQKSRNKYKQTNAEERIASLRKLQGVIVGNLDKVFGAIQKDFGKPAFETLTGEIMILLHELEDACKNLPEWMKQENVAVKGNTGATAQIIYESRGTVLIIGPWNFPFSLTLSPLIATIAAGNNALIKPSELTPSISKVIKELIDETFDDDFVSVIEGGIPETTALLALPFDHIFFTGSPKVGKIVMEAAAKNLSSVTLELGGKSPAIIDKSADLQNASIKILRAKTLNSGQICMAPDYLLIPKDLQDEFVSHAAKFVEDAYFKEGEFSNVDYVQIVNQRNFDRLKLLYDDALAKGATVLYGGEFDIENRRIRPTILANVPLDAAMMQEEIFGPILPVFHYENINELPAFIEQFDKPLAFYLFSNDDNNVNYLLDNTTSGGACINDFFLHYGEVGLPFGGVNSSGIGSYHGVFGFRELSNAKGVYFQPQEVIDTLSFPPYEGKLQMMMDMFLKK